MTPRSLFLLLLSLIAAGASYAADLNGTWTWATKSPAGDIETVLKLAEKEGKLAGAYSNQFGETAISDASIEGDIITFNVVRDLGGKKYVVKYRGNVEGNTIKGTIEAPGHDGGNALKMDWTAKRVP